MDAHVGVEVLGINYMNGEQPRCGFPEKSYIHMSSLLANAGYKVAVIDQVFQRVV